MVTLSWHNLLRCEQEMRAWAIKRVNMGTSTLAQALMDAAKDNELKTKYVVAAMAFDMSRSGSSSGKRAHVEPPTNLFEDTGRDQKKATGKGKTPKGRGKGGKGGSQADEGTTDTNNFNVAKRNGMFKKIVGGKAIRWGYNKKSGCTNVERNFLHVCVHCGVSHSLEDCPKFTAWLRRNKK